jgi:trans-2,3-dihydro-3-hydroxyanthranilate isomerase
MTPSQLEADTKIRFDLYDSFTTRRFGGNVAGVVLLERFLAPSLMQRIATELGAATTGFALARDSGSVRIRFFTPRQEIDACGHVTVAIAAALLERGVWEPGANGHEVRVTTSAGVVSLHLTPGKRSPKIGLSYRPRSSGPPSVSRGDIEAVLGSETDTDSPIEVISTGLRHLIVPFKTPEDLARLEPSEQPLIRLGNDCGVQTVCAFTPLGARRVRMRDFCAPIGALEEAASGTTSAALASYLASGATRSARAARILVQQGMEMGRPSRIEVIMSSDSEGQLARVWGSALRTVTGVMDLR